MAEFNFICACCNSKTIPPEDKRRTDFLICDCSINPLICGLDDFYCMDIEELKLCFERVSHYRLWIHLSKEQIIDGIQWRAQEELPDDPNYVRIQTRKLDYIFNSQLEDLTYETTEILREIDCLEEN